MEQSTRIMFILCAGVCLLSEVYAQQVTLQVSPNLDLFQPTAVVTISCSLSFASSMAGVFRLYINGSLLMVQTSGIFVLNGGNSSVSGDFSCSSANTSSASRSLLFVEAPTLTSNDGIISGQLMTLTCNSNVRVPNAIYTFYIGGTQIQSSAINTYTKLLIASDAGAYRCTVSAGAFTSPFSAYFIVTFNPPPAPTLTYEFDGKYGSPLTLQCRANQANAYDLIWSRLYKGASIKNKIAQVAVTTTTATFSEIAITRTAGTYTCTVYNKKGESVASSNLPVSVAALAPATPTTEAIGAASKLVATYINCTTGYNIDQALYCTLYINVTLRYADDVDCLFPLPHGASGELSCSVTTQQVTSPISSYKTLTFFEEPSVLPVSPLPPQQDQAYVLRCVSSINGTFKWFKKGDPTLLGTETTLTVPIRSYEKFNSYQCVVTYFRFNIESLFYTVYSSAPDTPTLTVTGGNGLLRNKTFTTFSCSSPASGDAFSLYRDGARVYEKPGTGSTTFVSKVGKNGAFYTCTTTNGYGESGQSNRIYVPGLNQLYVTANNPLKSTGQSLTLNCSMKSPPPNVIYTWKIYKPSGEPIQVPSQVIPFFSVTTNDRGLYTCQVNVNGQIITADNYYILTFEAPPAPDIILTTSTTSATAIIQCFVQSNFVDVSKSLKLYRGDKRATDLPYQDTVSFDAGISFWRYYTVDTSVPANQGVYKCTSQNYKGESAFSNTVYVAQTSVFTKPSVSPTPPNPGIGSSIIMTCNAFNTSLAEDYQFTWLKEFRPMMRSSQQLSLDSLTAEDDGFYTCTYEFMNQGAKIKLTSDPFYLSLRKPLQPSLLLDAAYVDYDRESYDLGDGPIFYTFGVGEVVHVKCLSQIPHIKDQEWKANGLKSPYMYRLYRGGNPVELKAGGEFAITSLSAGNYTYTCRAETGTDVSEPSYPLVISVTSRPEIFSQPDAGIMKLACMVSMSNGYDILWRKNGFPLRERSNLLNLRNLGPSDEGLYSCRQQHGPSFSANSVDFILTYGNKTATPDIVGDDFSERGSSGVINCIATSTFAYKAVFYKNGVPVYSTTEPHLDEGGQVFFMYRISAISANDSGSYTCTIESKLGISDPTSATDVLYVGQCSNNPCEQVCQEDNQGSSFSCLCAAGYKINNDKITCSACDATSFGNECASTCACNYNNSVCDKVNGTCLCLKGWEGATCDNDTNECERDAFICNNASNCINTNGSYQCTCPAGYYSTGTACQDINECIENPCKPTQTCVNLNGTYSCVCKQGFQITATSTECVDIDECSVDNPCAQNCSNSLGGYQCGCYPGNMQDEYNRCVSVYTRTFEIHYPSVTPPASVLTANSNDSDRITKEIYDTTHYQMKQLARGYLDIKVTNLREGSLIASVQVYMNNDYRNLAGFLAKALTSMNMSLLTINGTSQPDSYIVYVPMIVRFDTPQCELRALIEDCLGNEHCLINDSGISYCQGFAAYTYDNEDKYEYLGLGIGVGVIAGIALTITILIIVYSRTVKAKEKKKNYLLSKSGSQRDSRIITPDTSLTSQEDIYQPESYFQRMVKRANLSNYKSDSFKES